MRWEAVDDADGYRLYVRTGSGQNQLLGDETAPISAPDGSLQAVLTGLSPQATSFFSVTAYSPGGESDRSNELMLDYASVASVIDTDADGLVDAAEDVNLNGVVDAGETDPQDADTDGDGISDYDEPFRYNTDPLNMDTDADGSADSTEIRLGTNPNDPTKAPNVWVLAAGTSASFQGAMTSSTQFANGADADPSADSLGTKLVYPNSAEMAWNAESDDSVTYRVELRHTGRWFLWGRFYYPGAPGSNEPNSFFVSVDGALPVSFGNNSDFFQRFHWDGDGEVSSGARVSLPLGTLSAGVHTITVEKRESSANPPRLDALLLTADPYVAPTDALAVAGFAAGHTGEVPVTSTTTSSTTTTSTTTTTVIKCSSDAACDDGNVCNGQETCNPSIGCVAGTPLTCNDGNACNGMETCDPVRGCRAGEAPVCDDGDVCNGVETCKPAIGCVAGTALTCSDGLYCNGEETCDPNTGCLAGTPIECGGLTTSCSVTRCTESARGCDVVPVANGTSCDDGAACTDQDACVDGLCTGMDLCEDGSVCNFASGMCELTGDADNDGLFDAEDPCPVDSRNECFGDVAVDREIGLPIRINAGESRARCSGRRVGCDGTTWYEDFGARRRLGGSACSLLDGCPMSRVEELFGCEDEPTDDVFRCDHTDRKGTRRLIYNFDVPQGTYLVNLYFANTNPKSGLPGSKVFDIMVENHIYYPDFDQVVEAGGSGIVIVRSVLVDVMGGNGLDITLVPKVGAVAIKAIEVLRPDGTTRGPR